MQTTCLGSIEISPVVVKGNAPLLALSSKLSEKVGLVTRVPRTYWVLEMNEKVKTISFSSVVLLTVIVQGLVRLLTVQDEGCI